LSISARSAGPRFLASNGTMHQATRFSRAKSWSMGRGSAARTEIAGKKVTIANKQTVNRSNRESDME
jgi:hypothetical protein